MKIDYMNLAYNDKYLLTFSSNQPKNVLKITNLSITDEDRIQYFDQKFAPLTASERKELGLD